MNKAKLRKIADAACLYAKSRLGEKYLQYELAKTYTTSRHDLSADEYDFVIRRIADKLEI